MSKETQETSKEETNEKSNSRVQDKVVKVKVNVYKAGNHCRACLAEINNREFFWLESYYLEKKFVDIYHNVTSIEVDLNEKKPTRVCTPCYDTIIKFDLFKTRTLECEKLLNEASASHHISFEYKRNDLAESEQSHLRWEEVVESDSLQSPYSNFNWNHKARAVLESKNAIDVVQKLEPNEPTDNEEIIKKPQFMRGKNTRRLKGSIRIPCKECGKKVLKGKMQGHIRVHKKDKPFGCEKCGACFLDSSSLNQHMVKHKKGGPHSCGSCEKTFARKATKDSHEATVHGVENQHECSLCGKKLKNYYCLYSHIKYVHERANYKDDQTGFVCSICGNVYKTKSILATHQKKHEEPKPFLCTICGKGYSTKAVLENHQKVHTGEKSFTCEVCLKQFRFISTYKTHIMIHNNEKPLICPVCGKCFRQHAHLKTHIRGQHTAERPYKCTYCGKTFKLSGNLVVHTRIHTGETPYVCEVCSKGFYDSSSMKKHRKGHFEQDKKKKMKVEGQVACGDKNEVNT